MRKAMLREIYTSFDGLLMEEVFEMKHSWYKFIIIKKNWKDILNEFMKGKSHSNEIIVAQAFL